MAPSRLFGATCDTNVKNPRRTGGPGPPGRARFGIFGPKTRGGPCADLPRSSGIIFSPKNRHPTMFVNDFHIFFKKRVRQNHENQTFRVSLKPQGPRDRACGKEREILCRIALTRALYDQMAPQLCHFYVPGKLRSFSSSFCLRFSPFVESLEITDRIKGTSQLVLFI